MGDKKAIRFQKANCVAVGAFNVAIVQPLWLLSKGLLPHGLEIAIQYKLDEPGGFRFTAPDLKVGWLVSQTRIVIETEDPQEDCGDLMARLLRLLPETPVLAVGNNAYYKGPADAEAALVLPSYPVSDPLPGESVQHRTFHVAIHRGTCVFNLQVTQTTEGIELLANGHCQNTGEGGTVLAQEHAKRFLEHRRACVALVRHYLKVEVDV